MIWSMVEATKGGLHTNSFGRDCSAASHCTVPYQLQAYNICTQTDVMTQITHARLGQYNRVYPCRLSEIGTPHIDLCNTYDLKNWADGVGKGGGGGTGGIPPAIVRITHL
jgi:hypothetical protein